MNNNRLLSTMREFAHDIHSSMPTVYKEIARGNLQTIKIGKRRFVTAEQRADYIRKKEAEAS
jgi:DNA-binding transcriptional regulator YhcF (GntR family)|tara:strand:- start:83 stop:268 length:186 start_codon:yes stop_codon:yes gene_type:complete